MPAKGTIVRKMGSAKCNCLHGGQGSGRPTGTDDPWGFCTEQWRYVVEDVKSKATKTRVYEMKKQMMLEKFKIRIREV